ncbi:hypothetical protein LBMAG53_38020 [Planctomycetota bacterium]|nr:hypothetical protein LBMAG53_38020 [Planctomycetota bacterium]
MTSRTTNMSLLAAVLSLSAIGLVAIPAAERGDVPLSVVEPTTSREVARFSESWALVIGNSAYRAPGYGPLPGVADDVQAVAEALRQAGFGVEVKTDLAKADLSPAIDGFIDRHGLVDSARLLIYYAGHGESRTRSDSKRVGYLIPVDCPSPGKDAQGFKQKALAMDQIEVLAKRIEARHALFVMDSCFAGTIFKVRANADRIPPAISDRLAKPVRQFLTAGDDGQTVPDQSIFRRYFVRGIAGEADVNHDGWVTATELATFVHDHVTDDSHGTQTPRDGKIQDVALNEGEFVFKVGTPVAFEASPSSASAHKAATTGAAVLSKPAWATSMGKDGYGIWADLTLGGEVQRMRLIKAGTFTMGSPQSEKEAAIAAGAKPEWVAPEVEHKVTLTQDFWLGDSEVTQGFWSSVIGGYPSRFTGDSQRPVEQVSWDDGQGLLKKINDLLRSDGLMSSGEFSFPTEAQWEYACRAGTTTAFSFGATITPEQVNYDGSGPYGGAAEGLNRSETMKVKSLPANAWGLHDMHGNVWEWCSDWHGDYPPSAVTAPIGPATGTVRVYRGGGWNFGAWCNRAANRGFGAPGERHDGLGLRLCAPVLAGP